jgi:hypothetical protein
VRIATKWAGTDVPALFVALREDRLSADCVDRAGINTCTAVDAGVCVDGALVPLLADSVDRAGIVTCTAVDALVGNFVSQDIHPLYRRLTVRYEIKTRFI